MQNETILCIAPRDWHGLWKEAQSIMSLIAIQNRVLYFDPGRDPQRVAAKEIVDNFPNFFRLHTEQVMENLTVISSPSSLPYFRRHLPDYVSRIVMPFIIKVNVSVLIRHVQRAIKKLDVKKPILWLYGPYYGDLIGKFNEKLSCYYNYDEFADFVSNRRVKEIVRYYEAQLCRRADVVLTTSQAQYKVRKAHNPNTYFVPNGVNFELFNRALEPGLDLPDDIAQISRPIVGFAGRLGPQIDVRLLRHVAETYSAYSLVLIGPDELPSGIDEKALRALKNVHFLGWKKPSDLPNYLQAFDAALIPYHLVGHVLSGYPTKLHEYLAAGRSVVATAMPELRPYKDVLRIGEDNNDFVTLVREAVEDKSYQEIEARVLIARENTWDKRVTDIYRIFQPMLS